MSRTEKSVKNIIWAIASQAITGVLAFAVRTALIKTVGIDAIAINGVLMEIVSVISLAEMGFGTLLIYNLHAPLANGDKRRISCLMNLFGRIYKIVAAVELSIGLLLIPFVGYIISTDTFTDVYVRVVLVLFLIRGALNCAVVPKTALLNADQKQYVVSAVILVFRVLGTCLLLIILCIWNEYVIFVLLDVAITLGMNCAIAIIVKKRYAYLNSKEKLCLQEMKRILSGAKDVFVKNASGKITHATDHLMISLMIGIEAVGYYSNYAMFLNIVKRIGGSINGAVSGSIGNLLAGTDSSKCSHILRCLTFLYYTLGLMMCACCYMCLSPIICIWIGSEFLLGDMLVMVCCIVLLLEFTSRPLWEMVTLSGMFQRDKYISILGSITNIVVSICLGKMMGMTGIFLGTICTYIIQIFMKIRLLYVGKFGISPKEYYRLWMKMGGSSLIVFAIAYIFKRYIAFGADFLSILLSGIIGIIIVLIVILFMFSKSEELAYAYRKITEICMLMKPKCRIRRKE